MALEPSWNFFHTLGESSIWNRYNLYDEDAHYEDEQRTPSSEIDDYYVGDQRNKFHQQI